MDPIPVPRPPEAQLAATPSKDYLLLGARPLVGSSHAGVASALCDDEHEQRGGTATIGVHHRPTLPALVLATRLHLAWQPAAQSHHEMSDLRDLQRRDEQEKPQEEQRRDLPGNIFSHWAYPPFPAGQRPPHGLTSPSGASNALSSFSSQGSSSSAPTYQPAEHRTAPYPAYHHFLPPMSPPLRPQPPPAQSPGSTLDDPRSAPNPRPHLSSNAAEDHEWSIKSATALRNLAHAAASAGGHDFGGDGGRSAGLASGLPAAAGDGEGSSMRWYSPSPPPDGIWHDERRAEQVGGSPEEPKEAGNGKGKKSKPVKKRKKHEDGTDAVARKYVCQECRKSFARPSALVVHERSHTNFQPHICPTCHRPFNVPSNLRRHQRLYNHHDPSLLDSGALPSPTDEAPPPSLPSPAAPAPASLARLLLPTDYPAAHIGSPAFVDSDSV